MELNPITVALIELIRTKSSKELVKTSERLEEDGELETLTEETSIKLGEITALFHQTCADHYRDRQEATLALFPAINSLGKTHLDELTTDLIDDSVAEKIKVLAPQNYYNTLSAVIAVELIAWRTSNDIH